MSHDTPTDDPTLETTDRPVTRRTALRMAGAAGVGTLALGATAGSAAATSPCDDCVPLGKVEGQPEAGDHYEFTVGEYTVVIEVEEVGYQDGEAYRLSWKVLDLPDSDYLPVCEVHIKGGPRIRTDIYEDGAYSAGDIAPTMHDNNPNRENYAISFIQYWVCVPEGTEVEETKEHPHSDGPPSSRGRGK